MTFKFWEDAEISSPPPPLHSTLKLEADIAWIRSYIDNPWIEQGIIGTLHIEICKKLVRKHFRKIKNQHMNSSLVKEFEHIFCSQCSNPFFCKLLSALWCDASDKFSFEGLLQWAMCQAHFTPLIVILCQENKSSNVILNNQSWGKILSVILSNKLLNKLNAKRAFNICKLFL